MVRYKFMLKLLCFVRVVLLRVVNVESCACKGTVEAFMCWPLCIGGLSCDMWMLVICM